MLAYDEDKDRRHQRTTGGMIESAINHVNDIVVFSFIREPNHTAITLINYCASQTGSATAPCDEPIDHIEIRWLFRSLPQARSILVCKRVPINQTLPVGLEGTGTARAPLRVLISLQRSIGVRVVVKLGGYCRHNSDSQKALQRVQAQ